MFHESSQAASPHRPLFFFKKRQSYMFQFYVELDSLHPSVCTYLYTYIIVCTEYLRSAFPQRRLVNSSLAVDTSTRPVFTSYGHKRTVMQWL